jgi:hypothetical protein
LEELRLLTEQIVGLDRQQGLLVLKELRVLKDQQELKELKELKVL